MEPSKKKIRVLLVDDYAQMRRALRRYLETCEDIEVVGEAEDGLAAVVLANKLVPDIITMDVEMPLMNGFEATQKIKETHPEIRVIAFTSSSQPGIEAKMMEAGVSVFLDKAFGIDDLHPAILRLSPGSEHDPSSCQT